MKVAVPDIWKIVRGIDGQAGRIREWVGIVIHHGAGNFKAERNDVQGYADYHTLPKEQGGRGYSDLGYHFGIEEDGGIWVSNQLEGGKARWIHQRPGGHTRATASLDGRLAFAAGVNVACIGICFAGNFNEQDLPDPAFRTGVDLCVELLSRMNVNQSSVYPHNRFQVKDCPGKRFPMDGLLAAVGEGMRKRGAVS